MLNRKNITFIVLLVLAMISVRFLPGCGEGLNILTDEELIIPVVPPPPPPPPPPIDPWSEYSYRRSVTVSNSGTSQADYQINIVFNSSNFSFSKADPAGVDIRFNYSDTSLPYWIENWDSVLETATVWVKVPSLPAGNTVLYVYYGKSGETAASDFDDTFTKDSGFSGLAARLHMDEGTGTSLDDSSANTNTGTASASDLWAGSDGGRWGDRTDIYFSTGDAVSFNGISDYVSIADNDSLDPGKITITFWFKAGSVTSGYLVSKWNTDASDLSYAVFLNGDSVCFYSSINGTSFNNLLQSDKILSVDTWYYIAAVYDGAAALKSIYIDGVEDKTTNAVGGSLFNSNSNLTLGILKAGGGNYYTGDIDEVSIYDRALSGNEITALYQRRKYSSAVADPVVGAEETVSK